MHIVVGRHRVSLPKGRRSWTGGRAPSTHLVAAALEAAAERPRPELAGGVRVQGLVRVEHVLAGEVRGGRRGGRGLAARPRAAWPATGGEVVVGVHRRQVGAEVEVGVHRRQVVAGRAGVGLRLPAGLDRPEGAVEAGGLGAVEDERPRALVDAHPLQVERLAGPARAGGEGRRVVSGRRAAVGRLPLEQVLHEEQQVGPAQELRVGRPGRRGAPPGLGVGEVDVVGLVEHVVEAQEPRLVVKQRLLLQRGVGGLLGAPGLGLQGGPLPLGGDELQHVNRGVEEPPHLLAVEVRRALDARADAGETPAVSSPGPRRVAPRLLRSG